MTLKSTSVNINDDVWYYEDKAGIEIIHWVTERDGYRKAHHIKISWRQLRASVDRKLWATQQKVQRTGGTVCTCGTGNTVPAEAHDHDCAIFASR